MKHKNDIVKILYDEDGNKIDKPVRHYATSSTDPAALCNGKIYRKGQDKAICRGNITCERCIKLVKEHKSITFII